MELGTNYFNALDKNVTNLYSLNPSRLGISTPPMKDQLEQLKARIFQGASVVELGFWGKGKGSMSQGATTPEMYGKEERDAMRELAKVNEITLTTHAAPAIGNLSGLTDRGFSDEARESALRELKRTIDFAADTVQKGPITIHTGEFPRSIQYKFGKEKFREYPEEAEKRIFYLVDERTGQINRAVREDEEIWVPTPDPKYKDQVRIVDLGFKEKTGKEAELKTPIYEIKNGNIAGRRMTFKEFKDEMVKEKELPEDTNEEQAAKLFNQKLIEAEQFQALGQADEYEYQYKIHRDRWEKFQKEKELLDKVDEKVGLKNIPEYNQPIHEEMTGRTYKNRYDLITSQLQEEEKQMSYGREIAIAARKNLFNLHRQKENTIPIADYGIKKSADTIAEAALYTYKKEKELEKQGVKLKEPMFLAPENIFPESGYGSHPDELRNLVLKSRETMIDKLWDKKNNTPAEEGKKLDIGSKKQAEDIADAHIKATFDIGHAYTWKKFFTGSEKEFKEWLLKKVEELTESGIIGHVHMTDNFGYEDEHVTPGQGTAPIKEFVEKLKEKGYKGPMIIEPGHQDYKAMLGAWRSLNSPIYRIDSSSIAWTDIENSYFGRTGSPRYLVGAGVPEDEPKEWTLWSGSRLE